MPLFIGADPEFFVAKDGVFVSGHTFKCGTKKAPMKTKHGAVQVDGLALEVNVTPAETKEAFIANILGVIGDLTEIVGPDHRIVAQPTAVFTKEYMQSLPRNVKELGCNPDYNAYTGGLNDAPNGQVLFRTGAGHVHLGWTKNVDPEEFNHFHDCANLARQLDYFLGLRTLKFDPDAQRRELYGKAGAFRPKPYGMEYRVPSSAWLNSPALMEEVFDATRQAFEYANAGGDMDKEHQGFAQVCIDKNIVEWETLNPKVAEEIGYAVS